MARNSAAWVVGIVAILAFLMGTLILSATDPIMQDLFDSSLWTSSTADGQNALNWQKAAWGFLSTAILIAILFMVLIETRQST